MAVIRRGGRGREARGGGRRHAVDVLGGGEEGRIILFFLPLFSLLSGATSN